MKTLHTIKFWAAWTLAVGLWLAEPFLSMRYYEVTQRLRFYPTNADSILIPIFWSFLVALVGAPFWFLLCRLAFRHLAGPFKQPPHMPPPVPPKALGIVFNRFKPSNWGRVRACLAIGTALVFGFIIYTQMESARGYDRFYDIMQKSDFSNLSELAVYLKISSYGWAVVWGILGICFIARILAGKDSNIYTKTIITPIMILAWVVAFAGAFAEGKVLWDKTEVRDQCVLDALAKEKEFCGTWQIDASNFGSRTLPVQSFREFKVVIHPGGSFTAKGIPPGILFNGSNHNTECSGTWKLTKFQGNEIYPIRFSIKNEQGHVSNYFDTKLEFENGKYVISMVEFNSEDTIPIVRTSTSTGEP